MSSDESEGAALVERDWPLSGRTVATGRGPGIEIRLDQHGWVHLVALGEGGGVLYTLRREGFGVQQLVDGLIAAQLEPLPGTLRRRWMLARGWRFFERRMAGS